LIMILQKLLFPLIMKAFPLQMPSLNSIIYISRMMALKM